MRRLLAVGLFLAAARLSAVPCAPTATRLCLNGNRFAAEVTWRDFQGNTGSGHPVSLTGDTGYFWFFSSTNVELVVKALDGRGINNNYWIFYGALSNVEYTMTVTDTVNGRTKVYANPSGNLGSVADTSAFAAAEAFPAARTAGVRTPETAERGGQSASATTSCAPTATSLCLNGGRFRAEVSWRDFAGNKGSGQAVALTADTGYFWFFNAANVELVVKVLDGRALNKNFWVFYGALSTVEYQLKVTDTVSGRSTFYTNPANNLASIADTSALGDGAFVQAVHDASRAVTVRIPTAGGTLSTTAADGSRFTLEIPKDALLSDRDVTLTPVSSIGGLPLSGGLAAAVHVEPEGLVLYESATLTIEPAAAVSRSEAITFSYQGAGAEFFLHPPLPGAGAIRVPVLHFTGFGVGRGTKADVDAQALRLPTLEVDQLSQRLAVVVLPLFRAGTFGAAVSSYAGAHTLAVAVCSDNFAEYLRGEYSGLAGQLADAIRDCRLLRAHLPLFRQYLLLVRGMECDSKLTRETDNVRELILSGQTFCFNESFTRCTVNADATQVIEIERWAQELRRDGHFEIVDPDKEHKCLHFDLSVDSSMEQHSDVVGEERVQWKSQSHLATTSAGLPVAFKDSTGRYEGSGAFNYLSASFSGTADTSCAISVAPKSGSTLAVKRLDIAFDTSLGYTVPLPPRLRLHYDIGEPKETTRKVCFLPTIDETAPTAWYRAAYEAAHTDEFDFDIFDPLSAVFGFTADLDFIGLHTQYGVKVYDTTDFMPPGEGPASTERHLSENTIFTLSHSPQR